MEKSDYVAGWEEAVEEAVGNVGGLLKQVGKDVISRPFGSTYVPMKERMLEWGVMRENPEALMQYADDQGLSDESMIREFAQMEKRWTKETA